MTTLLAGLGPAGRVVLTAMMASGRLPELCSDGLVVVDPQEQPGGGALLGYNVRSDSAAAVFAECVRAFRDEPEVSTSSSLAHILALPDGETVALPVVGTLLSEATVPLVRHARDQGADVRLGARLVDVRPRAAGGTFVTTCRAGRFERMTVSRLIIAIGGAPYVPDAVTRRIQAEILHSDELLRPAGLQRALDALPPDPRVVVIGRAHSAFAVANKLLSSSQADRWGSASVTALTRGPVRVTYPDVATARADGATFSPDDVCPQSQRVWRLCGLRGDAARRYRLGRDGIDPRLSVVELQTSELTEATSRADLVIAATGYRSASLRLLPGSSTRADGSVLDRHGRPIPGIRSIGLGSGSRRNPATGGEPSYDGPVDGVWHYQTAVAPPMLEDLFGRIGEDELEDSNYPVRARRRRFATFSATTNAP
jgi:hypothetical protein